MKRDPFRRTWLCLAMISCIAPACGSAGRVADVADAADTGPAPREAGVPPLGPDASAFAADAGAPPSAGGCDIHVSGAYASASSDAAAWGDLEQTSAGFHCTWRQGEANVGFWVSIPGAARPGAYAGMSATIEVSQSGGGAIFQGACAIELLRFAPAAKGGMAARFSCPSLAGDGDLTGTSFFGDVAVVGAIELPPAATSALDAGTSGGSDAATSCSMTVHGAYEATGSGEGDNNGCLVQVAGTGYYVAPFGPSGPPDSERMEVTGNSWCPSCLARYYASPPCAYDITLDQGVRGRFVATFDCEGLRAGDGTTVGTSGSIDGIHQPPPQ